MAAPMKVCACHIQLGESGPVTKFTDISWQKICESVEVWKLIDGIEKKVAGEFDKKNREGLGYHRKCYQRFTCRKRIEQGKKRKENGRLRPLVTEINEHESEQSSIGSRPILRSQLPSSSSVRRSVHVLPDECIICRQSKTVVEKSTRKRKLERLITCESNAEKLLEAAQMKGDERILLQIGPFDPVCIEVKYHASCYKRYIRCLYNNATDNDRPLSASFELFCKEIIEKRLISGGEVLKINYLTRLFITMVWDTEHLDISDYRNWQLKARMSKRYPFLQFVQPESRCCELVFYLEESDATVLNISLDDSESDCDSIIAEHNDLRMPEATSQDDFAQLYRSAVEIRGVVESVKGLASWPPNADQMSIDNCLQFIPCQLFNFLAWSCGLSEQFSTERVTLKGEDNLKKVVSIAQDIISLSSQGKKLMPKHVALGMTLRHLTGSAKLQRLINSFGHCSSHSFTLELDTALATQQLERATDVPDGFRSSVFTTLVWDNNDFGEETLTGKGTTHNTNGIIIQRVRDDPVSSLSEASSIPNQPRDRKRTIQAPHVDIKFFHSGKRCGPDQFQGQDIDLAKDSGSQVLPRLLDEAYYVIKTCQSSTPLPGWTGCNQLLVQNSHPLNRIGYLPVIDASPTQTSTVNTILEKSLEIADALQLHSVVVVMDQAVYAKAQEIRWQGRDDFRERIVLRLGEFHTAMAFLGCIGKRFEHAGLSDIAIESGLVAEGSINGVMSGHHYNRSVRCHKIICEALQRLKIEEYLDSLNTNDRQAVDQLIHSMRDGFPGSLDQCISSRAFEKFVKNYTEYTDRKTNENAMYGFWASYLQMVEQLLLFLRATRTGNWDLHLSAVRDMLPWYFAYGRINYSRYLPVYYMEMRALPQTHPSIHTKLMDGEFAVKRQDHHGFDMTACDQIIEQTFNRDSKTKGGLTGITLNKGAVHRWILSQPSRAAITNACYRMSSGTCSSVATSHRESNSSRVQKDEQTVQDVMETIREFTNPFCTQEGDELVNICSGKVAPVDIKENMESAYNRGEEAFNVFITDRLLDGKKDIFEKLVLPHFLTFSHIDKKTKSKTTLLYSSAKEDRQLLARMLIVAQEKGLDLKDVLSYPLSSTPSALANFDGTMAHTNKAALMHEVENQVSKEYVDIPMSSDNVLIIDAMAYIQQQRHVPETFGLFATAILKQIVSLAQKQGARRVDFVADRYHSQSTKVYEREKRSSKGQTQVRITRPDQKMPKQMSKFLACGSNKEALIHFFVNEWKKCTPDQLSDVQVYATTGESCFRVYVSTSGTVEVQEIMQLKSDQEEADTRMFLHAYHVSQSQRDSDIVIYTVDTDVFILSLYVSTLLKNRILLHLHAGSRSRLIDVTQTARILGNDVAEALVGLHSFTGCDTVSAFKGKGKLKALKLIMKFPTYIRTFSDLGKAWLANDSLQKELEKFVCELYGWGDSDSVNAARYNSFRCGHVTDCKLPPNADSLKLHVMRANYQTKVYRSCLLQNINAPSPTDHGWKITESMNLSIRWSTMPIAPDQILKNVHCSCQKSSCDSLKCSCKKGGMNCTDMCKCNGCQNRQNVDLPEDSDSDNSDD